MIDYGKRFRLDGKVALVTGAARGIGAEIAMALAQAGAAVLVSDVADGGGKATVAAIRKMGGKAEACVHDVTDEAQWEAAVAKAQSAMGRLDIVVNNAGIETAALLSQCTLEDFRQVLDVNVSGVFLGVKHAIRAMAAPQGAGGAIINLSSVAGLIGTTGHAAYHTSKGAVRLLTKAAAVECAQLGTGIRVNSVHPAIVATEMGTNFIQHFVDLGLAPDYATAEGAIKGAHPLGRFGEPADVASAVVYLASDAAQWMTGTELVLDGGYTAA
ncbi:glucose 1-dehydrogenase [Solimonas marina]|uniref:Glucose 1-dehydrogenase n=1 Tax=Solimonas marina TaxID=2714601 RepID=A0A969W9A8_9GAMM|nr:glucose 1-dehydrogenase [Solimonas marina]NKF21858.1 glucose 1-dehydrogenase [Solimonas marina]